LIAVEHAVVVGHYQRQQQSWPCCVLCVGIVKASHCSRPAARQSLSSSQGYSWGVNTYCCRSCQVSVWSEVGNASATARRYWCVC